MMDDSIPSYADLPMEILFRIMSYLNPSDVLEASLSCRRWFDASLHMKFLSHLQIQFDTFNVQSSPLKIFAESARFYTKIKLSQVDLDQTSIDFWRRFGNHLMEIEFCSCDMREKTFVIILKLLTNLMCLKIENCSALLISGRLFRDQNDLLEISKAVQNVKHLSLRNNRYLSDALFSRIVRSMNNIQSLNLSGCYISFHPALYRKFYPAHQHEPSESVFTFIEIMKFVETHASQLKCLNFSETLIDGNALHKLSEVDSLKIEELKLRSCDQLTNSGISKFFEKQKEITVLDLSKSVRFTDPSLLDICRTLKNLKVLKIRRCRAITDSSLKDIRLLSHLECLDISECDAITSIGFNAGILHDSHNNLIELHVSALNICEFDVFEIARTMKSLRVLDLSFCRNAVTDLAVQMIFKHLTYLRSLNLEFCDMVCNSNIIDSDPKCFEFTVINQDFWRESKALAVLDLYFKKSLILQISDAGITGMGMRTQVEKYESGDKNKCDGIDQQPSRHPYRISLRSKAEEDIVNNAKQKIVLSHIYEQSLSKEEVASPYTISRLKGLRSLNLSSCNRVSDVSLKYAFEFSELESLSVSKCQQISAIGIESVSKKCPSIKFLNLSNCHNLSDEAINEISVHLKRLTHLYIEKCSQLTDNSLEYISINCRRLKYLDLRGCRFSSEPCLRLENVRSLHSLVSKPGPYMASDEKQIPKAPPMDRLTF